MSRKPISYWEKRSTELMKSIEKDTQYTIKDLINIYNKSKENIQKDIENVFKNYGKDSKLDKRTLEKMLNTRETETHYKNLLQVINNNIIDKDIKKKMLAKYNAPAYSYRISRLQALEDKIDIEISKMADLEKSVTKDRYIKTIENSYYHTMFDIQQGTGLGFSFSGLNMRKIKTLLAMNWIDNANFSNRIWRNKERLNQYMKSNFVADIMTGKSIQSMSRSLSEHMNVGLFNSTRLLRTEVNHFANESSAIAYEECEIEKYRYIATLDNRTCDRCGSLDNKIFKLSERKSGVNYPPLHANDRCTTITIIEDEELQNLTRLAKDKEGNKIIVPADMKYDEWEAKYVNMSIEQKGAISEYSSSKAYTLNEKLRNGKELSEKDLKLIKNIDEGLLLLPNYTNETYRQIGFDFQGEKEYNKFIKAHVNNTIINYGQYISTSKGYNDYEISDKLKVDITIRGKTGKDIRGLAGIKEEREVLFGRNVNFKVLEVHDNKILLEEV